MKNLIDFLNSGTVKQQNQKKLGAWLICATAILLAIALVMLIIASVATAIKSHNSNTGNEDDSGTAGTVIPNGYTTTTFDATQLSMGNLLLVDADHPCTATPVTKKIDGTRPSVEGVGAVYSVWDTTNYALTEETLNAFNSMMSDFYEETKDANLYVMAAYNPTAVNQVTPLHKTGCAVSLGYYDPSAGEKKSSIYNVDTYEWIYDNAASYGFIQASAEEGEEHIFRYVGVAHATYMFNNNKTLSEYLTLVQTKSCRSPLSITAKDAEGNSVGYSVYYLASGSDLIVPTKYHYTVSGDNMGGYIITVDKSSPVQK